MNKQTFINHHHHSGAEAQFNLSLGKGKGHMPAGASGRQEVFHKGKVVPTEPFEGELKAASPPPVDAVIKEADKAGSLVEFPVKLVIDHDSKRCYEKRAFTDGTNVCGKTPQEIVSCTSAGVEILIPEHRKDFIAVINYAIRDVTFRSAVLLHDAGMSVPRSNLESLSEKAKGSVISPLTILEERKAHEEFIPGGRWSMGLLKQKVVDYWPYAGLFYSTPEHEAMLTIREIALLQSAVTNDLLYSLLENPLLWFPLTNQQIDRLIFEFTTSGRLLYALNASVDDCDVSVNGDDEETKAAEMEIENNVVAGELGESCIAEQELDPVSHDGSDTSSKQWAMYSQSTSTDGWLPDVESTHKPKFEWLSNVRSLVKRGKSISGKKEASPTGFESAATVKSHRKWFSSKVRSADNILKNTFSGLKNSVKWKRNGELEPPDEIQDECSEDGETLLEPEILFDLHSYSDSDSVASRLGLLDELSDLDYQDDKKLCKRVYSVHLEDVTDDDFMGHPVEITQPDEIEKGEDPPSEKVSQTDLKNVADEKHKPNLCEKTRKWISRLKKGKESSPTEVKKEPSNSTHDSNSLWRKRLRNKFQPIAPCHSVKSWFSKAIGKKQPKFRVEDLPESIAKFYRPADHWLMHVSPEEDSPKLQYLDNPEGPHLADKQNTKPLSKKEGKMPMKMPLESKGLEPKVSHNPGLSLVKIWGAAILSDENVGRSTDVKPSNPSKPSDPSKPLKLSAFAKDFYSYPVEEDQTQLCVDSGNQRALRIR